MQKQAEGCWVKSTTCTYICMYANLLLRFCSKSTSCWKVKLLKLFELTKRQQRAKWRRRCPRKNWIKTGIKSDKVNLCTTTYKQGCSTKRGERNGIVETVAELCKRKTERHIRFKCISLLVDTSRFRSCRAPSHFALSPAPPHVSSFSRPLASALATGNEQQTFQLSFPPLQNKATIKFGHYFCLFSCWSIKFRRNQRRMASSYQGVPRIAQWAALIRYQEQIHIALLFQRKIKAIKFELKSIHRKYT